MAEREPRAVVEAGWEAFQRGDVPGFLDLLAEDVEWHLPGPPDLIPFAGTRHGPAAVAEFFGILAGTLEFLRFERRGMVAGTQSSCSATARCGRGRPGARRSTRGRRSGPCGWGARCATTPMRTLLRWRPPSLGRAAQRPRPERRVA